MRHPRLTVLTRAVHSLHPPGGMERAVFEQLRHLRALALPLSVITQPPTQPAALTASADLNGVDWQFVRYRHLPLRAGSVLDRLTNYPLFVSRVGQLLAERPALTGELVHAHGLLAAAAPADRPLVYAPHGLEEFSRVDWRKWLAYAPMRRRLRQAARHAAAILATDAAMAPLVSSALRVEPGRVYVIPNGVAMAGLRALVEPERQRTVAERLGLAASSLRLVTCVRLEQNKGLLVGLSALAIVRHRLPADWHWWIVGRGRQQSALQQHVTRLGLANHVTLVGWLDDRDLHNLLPQMHLFLLPTLYEGSSIATLEAMTHGLPVLASRVGGLPDKVLPGRTGYLVEPGEATALADRLLQALAERSHWAALGEAGRALVQQHFDWPAIARQLLSLYEQLDRAQLAGRRPPE